MHTTNDIHQQFAEFFNVPALKPYAYLLSKGLSEGQVCLDLDSLDAKKEELPTWYQQLLTGSEALKGMPLVATDGSDGHPFVQHGNRLYLQRYFRYESLCLRSMQRLLAAEKAGLETRQAALEQHRDFIAQLFAPQQQAPAPGGDWQLAAAVTAALHHFTIITGGPGTGKTTTVAKLLAILYRIDPDLRVALAAPTGKAAARMAESLRNTTSVPLEGIREKFSALAPATIHRLLKSRKDSPYFHHNAANPLPYDVVVVDESSMIDLALLAKLLDAIGEDSRLILLGDKDQLAAVEAGSLFGDLCLAQEALNVFSEDRHVFINRFATHPHQQLPGTALQPAGRHPLFHRIVELRHSHRFAGDLGIGRLSRAILQGDEPALRAFLQPGYDAQVLADTAYAPAVLETFIAGYQEFIREPDIRAALRQLNNLRVLCALREGPQGLYATNKAIEGRLHKQGLVDTRAEYYENRPIILTRNYYEHGLFNGDTGIIRGNADGVLMAWFEDSTGALKAVLPGYLTDAETAFAMTIHKSQGSEFGEVLVLLPQTADAAVLTRELLYTAITRARNRVVLQASEAVLLYTAARTVARASGIAARLAQL